ncbi:MAG TPA: polyhydroxyalkanoate synthesis repressor PhaR [Gammaproteobacteria bacterium]|nr:polyhydroxyalkanoate synthesis repressor PhaR [Gammaproteobacteria bacterium]
MNSTPRIIKKYANRRLYDTELSRYITLEEIRQLVLNNVSFRVIEAKTGADITKSTLLLIISEQEESADPVFSLEVLQHLIRSYSDNAQSLLSRYLEQSLSFFIQQKQRLNQHPQDLFQEWSKVPFEWMQEFFNLQQKMWTSDEDDQKKPSRNTKKQL